MAVLQKINNILNPKKLIAVPHANIGEYGATDLQAICDNFTQPGVK